MVKSSKTGRELTGARAYMAPEPVRRFFAFFGIRPPESPGEEDESGD